MSQAADRVGKRIYTPEAIRADLAYMRDHAAEFRATMRGGGIDKAFGERIMLAVTAVNGCRYCSYAHAKAAALSGISDEEVQALLGGEIGGDVPADQAPALLFAQHYAESGGHPDPAMVEQLARDYGEDHAGEIMLHIRAITMGNLLGNTADAILSRLRGQPAEGSTLRDELRVFAEVLAAMPGLARSMRQMSSQTATRGGQEVKMKVLIYGAGVTGSLYAARLAQGGHDVSLLARGQRLADLREQGLLLEDLITGERLAAPIDTVERLAPEDAYGLIIVMLPKDRIAEVLPILAANQATPAILFLGNNAAGPDDLAAAVGRERLLMGFPGAGGTRDGALVRFMDSGQGQRFPVVIGAPYPEAAPHLAGIVAAFQQAGIPVSVERRIDDWLKSHVALILPLAGATYMAGIDVLRLARTRDALVLLARALQESMGALRAAGVRITPPLFRLISRLPEPLLIAILRRRLQQPAAQHGLSHAHAARAEMMHLAREFSELSGAAGYPTPVLDFLCAHIQPDAESLPEGASQLPVNWRGVWEAIALFAGTAALWATISILRRGEKAKTVATSEDTTP